MTHYAYIFEANSIQRYILASGKLKECVGASEMLVDLTGAVLDSFCENFNLQTDVQFSRRAGGAIYAFTSLPSTIDTLSTAWPLIVRQFMPGLGFSQSVGSGATEKIAFDNARRRMLSNRNYQVAESPGVSPAVALAQRTGRPAIGQADSDGEYLDATAVMKAKYSRKKGLITRFCTSDDFHWPLNLHRRGLAQSRRRQVPLDESANDFPFQYPGQYLAIIHIDGNSLGQRLLSLGAQAEVAGAKGFVESFRGFSDTIEASTTAAAAAATTAILLPNSDSNIVPARPIVLGGDDLTVIVRADLALAFVRVFLTQFEEETKTRLNGMSLDGMTACAGIAYVKPTYPFHLGHEIAESLCGLAKRHSKRTDAVPSSICFSRTTNALGDEHSGSALSLGAYALHQSQSLPAIGDLLNLMAWVTQASAASRFRGLLGLAANDPQDFQADYQRWRDLTLQRERRDDRKAGAPATEKLAEFDGLLAKLNPPAPDPEMRAASLPTLGDLLTLVAVKCLSGSPENDLQPTPTTNAEASHA